MRISDWSSDVCSSDLFKLNRQQIMGRVLLQTPHAVLGEQTNREGLVRSEASDALRKILMWAIDNEMRDLINEADEIELEQRKSASNDTTRSRRRSEEHTSELQSLMRISYAVFCLKKKKQRTKIQQNN